MPQNFLKNKVLFALGVTALLSKIAQLQMFAAKKFPILKFVSALDFKDFSFAGYYGLDDAMGSAMSFAVLREVINGVGNFAENRTVKFAPVWQDGLLSSIFIKAELSALSLAVAFIGRKNG